jgi:protein-S-isoprenylcysteine O-methyltransferase Ste14
MSLPQTPPLVTVAVTALVMKLTAWALPALTFAVRGQGLLALSLGGLGVAVAALGVISFRRARTTVNPLRPERASALVATGVYHWSRNPMYLGMLMVLIAWALHLGNLSAPMWLPVFVAFMNRSQIVPEERALATKFGEEFESYRAKVRRWL